MTGAYKNKTVAVFCSTDAIIPQWAFMLVAPFSAQTTEIYFGTTEEVEQKLFL